MNSENKKLNEFDYFQIKQSHRIKNDNQYLIWKLR